MAVTAPDPSGSARASRPRRRGRRRLLFVAGAIVAVLFAVRIAAPYVIEAAINDRLERIPAYEGTVGDVDLSLWRGAYALDDVDVRKSSGETETPFFSARRIDFSLAWRELVRGRVVSDIVVDEGRLVFVRAEREEASQLETDARWQDAISDIFPVEITHLEVNHGQLHWVDHTLHPELDISVHDLHLVATGLRNRQRAADADILPAAISAEGRTTGEGEVRLLLRLAPLETPPHFDLDLEIRSVPLPAWNDLLRAYANVDVSRGTFEMYLEVAARDGAFRGYVKPFFHDLNFKNVTDRERPVLEKIWESVVNFMENILQNPDSEQLGTRVPFSGDFSGTEVGTFTAIINAVRYGFGAAFSESVEGDIEPSDVQPADGG